MAAAEDIQKGLAEVKLAAADEALLTVLRQAGELYEEQQLASKAMRKGFLDMAKARQSMGRGALSCLDVREDFKPQHMVEMNADAAGEAEGMTPRATPKQLEASALWHRHRKPAAKAAGKAKAVRRRGGQSDDQTDEGQGTDSDSLESTDASPTTDANPESDPALLFGGLLPPALRRSKQDFAGAVGHYVAAANAAHRVLRSLAVLEEELGRNSLVRGAPEQGPPRAPVKGPQAGAPAGCE
mmetsp:Transcript_6998/g.15994  ORF Transcript_6998/g.15994 Transcript_6998/m.15994 type:complete len:241 (-) Transcript_6998:340-1062(-)|eukprot:CAMPEP_0172612010 /NCGR_PEP_ID=MMETSP1068-20121228/31634_1 /TAXON_ID=35684 /ORGANISM="Pseudopedinella elastica, Strain CCMP716" /LENGTH=240 /DNA_ID=CAMNT_0013416133 /DNA_START=115 /DNA_END=837 /DNA_ORIENTATION=+